MEESDDSFRSEDFKEEQKDDPDIESELNAHTRTHHQMSVIDYESAKN